MTGRNKFERFKIIIKLITKILSLFPKKILKKIYLIINSWSGYFALVIRYCIIKNLCKECGENVYIASDVEIKSFENLSIGSNVSIHRFCYIDATGDIEIGNNVSIAHNTSLISFDHSWNDIQLPIKYNKLIFGKIVIEDDIWIGAGVRVLRSVHLKKRTIVSAGAIVTKGIYEGSIILGGIPAKKIKQIKVK